MNPFTLPLDRIEKLAAEHGTPLYIVSRSRLRENFDLLNDNLSAATLFYAVKTNPHAGILETLKLHGAGFDVASRGEIRDAVNAGANPRTDLIFADTVKDPKQIAYAHSIGIDDFTFDNPSEITQIARHAPGSNVLVRIMVSNKGSVAHLSKKFGCEPDEAVPLLEQARTAGLKPRGISFHVGSQCLETQRFLDGLETSASLFEDARAAGMDLEMLDIGGGFPVRYEDEKIDIPEMCRRIDRRFHELFGPGVQLVAEPGRVIVGDAVILVTKVISESVRKGVNWLYFDDGTYGSFMEVLLYRMRFPYRTSTSGPAHRYVLAGPTCDSIDVFSRDRQGEIDTVKLPEMHLDDLLIAGAMGAYTYSESTRFNGFDPPAFIYID